MAKFCKYCGTPLKEGAKFCPKCGKPVQAATLPAEAAPQPAQVVADKAETNPKKRGKGGLIAACVVVILALGGGAAWLFLSGDKGDKEQSSYGKPSAELVKQGYAIDLPKSAGSDIQIEKVDPEKLRSHNLIGQPVNVTRGGDSHVQLEEMAHVSFPIPEGIAQKDYIDLMGVLIVDGKPVYMVPEYEGLCNGMVSFETSHFCYAGMTKMEKEKRRNEFINRIAATEWVAGMSEKDLQKTVKQRLTEVADRVGLGEHDLVGMAVREAVSDIGFVKDAADLIESYDNGEPGELEAVIAEKITYKVQEKVLAVFFNKLKGDIERNVVTYDPDTKRITRTKEVEKGKYSDYISALEKELGRENMQELGEKLDKGESLKSIAKSFIKKKAVSWAKDFSTKMIPQ
ncbi:MAG: zinc-ribbon domain-containing protein, partial [Bacteroidales bacterium]|nr:zinc-ribbon domain-containing protein [Bacteroidales bacterium]